MRMSVIWIGLIALCLLGFSLALRAQPDEAHAIRALQQADNAREAFAEAWNDWATKHDAYTISSADKDRFRKVRKSWKEFDRLCRSIEY